jgi:hypothetical protein
VTDRWDKCRQRVGQRKGLDYVRRRRVAARFWLTLALITTALFSALTVFLWDMWRRGVGMPWTLVAAIIVLGVATALMLLANARVWRDIERFDQAGNEWRKN